MSALSFKKMALSATLIGTGAITMLQYLILDKTVFNELDESDIAYISYIALYGKNYYTLKEYQQRKAIFDSNVKLTSRPLPMDQSYELGLNNMSDWTMEEYFAILGLLPEG